MWDDKDEKTRNVLGELVMESSLCSYLDGCSNTTLPNLAKPHLAGQPALWVFVGESAGDAKATCGRAL